MLSILSPFLQTVDSSPLAVQFMRAVQQQGVAIPEDLAVIGYDYFPWADMLKVPLTTIEQPIAEMATAAVDITRTRLTEPGAPLMHTVLPHKLVVRASPEPSGRRGVLSENYGNRSV